ncbi:hypothetical protein NA57DRAFT_37234 [Rhizodiscina lignyota]|uniref:Uncharacterized protein n=1 Tax=Rhizodiscina lignyota TaxID=1504668 RepID=A0A9P4IKP4_9PEZI|nr:hypothetical protein NA57DRAFT_37234 [Rhizodiscina lignyota]
MAANKSQTAQARPGDILLVIHDFTARSPDELTLARGDRIELIERDDDFGDGWFLGKHMGTGATGLFPEVYTTTAPKGILSASQSKRPVQSSAPAIATTNGAATATEKSEQPHTPEPDTSQTPSEPNSAVSSSEPRGASAQRSSLPTNAQRINTSHFTPIDNNITSPVMNETLSVIEEHISDMGTPRHSIVGRSHRGFSEPGAEYTARRLSHINGEETDEEENSKVTEEEVLAWSADRVAEYLEDVGVEKKHCDVFKEQEITGEVLLGMDQSSVFLKEFELGPVGRRLKTWHKIRQLQMDVGDIKGASGRSLSDYSGAGASADPVRDRSASAAGTLPRIPSLNEHDEHPAHSRTETFNSQSPQPLFQNENDASTGAQMNQPRPSAASIRSLNHNRRHSSIDYAQASPSKTTSPQMIQSASPTGMSHQKQSSFDRTWTMGSHRPSVSTGSASGRPVSTLHGHSTGSEMTATTGSTLESSNVTVVSSIDLDRGYFSGNEADNRKNNRNVLRKGQSPSHSRAPSFSSFRRRSGSTTHFRGNSNDSVHDSVGPMTSPGSKSYYGSKFKYPKRAASGPEPTRTTAAQDYPPTVTKLEYNNAGSIDAIASSPHLIESETSSLDKPSPVNPSTSTRSFPKMRITGLRAISDAVTSGEKDIVTSPADMPQKDSPMQSPVRTGSSTPSGTSKSLDMEDAPAPVAVRRKTKKATSAYTRGLEKKTPQEQMLGCDYSGWMKKKSSNVMATWKSRLFVLRGRRLSYYYSENDTEEKGLIDISSHRVLPANDEKIIGFHATITGAKSPTSPQNAITPTTAATQAAAMADEPNSPTSGIFIFKLVPPREGLSKAVNFTKPTVHYFAVDNIKQGRLWMAALMKATIDRDDTMRVITTYNQKTISLAKARAMMTRPPALMGDDSPVPSGEGSREGSQKGLGLLGLGEEREVEENGDGSLSGSVKASLEYLTKAEV